MTGLKFVSILVKFNEILGVIYQPTADRDWSQTKKDGLLVALKSKVSGDCPSVFKTNIREIVSDLQSSEIDFRRRLLIIGFLICLPNSQRYMSRILSAFSYLGKFDRMFMQVLVQEVPNLNEMLFLDADTAD